MIANIQGYHVSVVTLVLPPFLPLSPFLKPKHSPCTTPHQCRITHFKTAAPNLHPHYHTGSAPQLWTQIRGCDAPAKRAGSCGVPGAGCHTASVRLSVPCQAASAPSPDDGQDAEVELPETGTQGPMAHPHLRGSWAGIGGLLGMRTPPHPTTAPTVNQRSGARFCSVTASLVPSRVAEGYVSLARVPARVT